MARKPRPWFRFYVEAFHDPKLRRRTPAQKWLWVTILGAARQSPIPGCLMASERERLEDQELADMAGMTVREVRAALPLFETSGMIEMDAQLGCWLVSNWTARQFESDDVTMRTARHRSRERSVNGGGNAPEQSRAEQTPSSPPVLETLPPIELIPPDLRDLGLATISAIKPQGAKETG